MRLGLAVLLAAVVAAVAGLIAAEYFEGGWIPIVAAVFIGFCLGELIASVGRDHGIAAQASAAVLAAASLGWAAWDGAGRGVAPVPLTAKVAWIVGAAVAVLTVRSSGRPAADTPDGS